MEPTDPTTLADLFTLIFIIGAFVIFILSFQAGQTR